MKLNEFVLKDGKNLRLGYTTGSYAAASAKAATIALFWGIMPERVRVRNPAGRTLKLKVEKWEKGRGWAKCAVKKDGGDDPDLTSGLLIWAKAEMKDTEGVEVAGGEGIGVVAKHGLPVKPGNPAINPTPMSMIIREVSEVLPQGLGVRVTISIPGGEKVSERAFNPRLGIVRGLSVLGTTGIITPMSTEGLKETLSLELSMLSAEGEKFLVLAPGNYGRDFARKSGFDERLIVTCGNFIGFALQKAAEYGFEKVHLVGELGKLIKVAAGIFDTSSRVADARAEIMTAYGALFGLSSEALQKLMKAGTTAEALDIIEESGIDFEGFCKFIAHRVRERCLEHVRGKLEISVCLFSRERGLLAEAGDDS